MANSRNIEAQAVRVERLREALRSESGDGARLAADPHDNPVCAMAIDQGVIMLTWKEYATSRQLRFVHEYMLLQIQRGKLTAILGDDARVPTVSAEDGRWIAHDWMPRALASGLRQIATTQSRKHFARVAIDEVHGAAPHGLQIRTFDRLEQARRWICGACEAGA